MTTLVVNAHYAIENSRPLSSGIRDRLGISRATSIYFDLSLLSSVNSTIVLIPLHSITGAGLGYSFIDLRNECQSPHFAPPYSLPSAFIINPSLIVYNAHRRCSGSPIIVNSYTSVWWRWDRRRQWAISTYPCIPPSRVQAKIIQHLQRQ